MKAIKLCSIIALMVSGLILSQNLEGIGGGGRGGGGGARGGGARASGNARAAGHNFSQSASMSRAQVPQRSNYVNPQRQNVQSYKQSPQYQNYQGRSQILSSPSPRVSQSAANINRGQSRAQIQQHINNTNIPQRLSQGQNEPLRSNIRETLQTQGVTANNVRQGLGNNYRGWFNNNFWDNHDYHPLYWNNAANWWGAESWAGVNSWLGYGWSDPVYYDYGYPIYVNASQDTEYLQAESTQLQQNVYSGGQEIAQGSEESSQPSGDWLPLGVFALVNDVSNAADANMFFQLALSKDGEISGSYYNNSVDKIFPMEGLVDKQTQLAAWKMSIGEGSPIFQTGVFNLTKSQTAVVVTYSDGSQQNWLLIRI